MTEKKPDAVWQGRLATGLDPRAHFVHDFFDRAARKRLEADEEIAHVGFLNIPAEAETGPPRIRLHLRRFLENPLDFTLSEATTGRRPSLHEIKTFISFFRRKSTTIFSFSVLSLSLSVFSTPDGFLPSRRTIGRYIGLLSPHLSPSSSSMLSSRISVTSP